MLLKMFGPESHHGRSSKPLLAEFPVPSPIFSEFTHQERDGGKRGEGRGQPGWGFSTWIHKGQKKRDRGLVATDIPSGSVTPGTGHAPLDGLGGGMARSPHTGRDLVSLLDLSSDHSSEASLIPGPKHQFRPMGATERREG